MMWQAVRLVIMAALTIATLAVLTALSTAIGGVWSVIQWVDLFNPFDLFNLFLIYLVMAAGGFIVMGGDRLIAAERHGKLGRYVLSVNCTAAVAAGIIKTLIDSNF